MDTFTPAERSAVMARVRSKNTMPEMKLRRELFRLGFRYRLHGKKLPAKPDIVLLKYRTVIFVNGCFWHSHECCPAARLPQSRREYWESKLSRNAARDKLNYAKLQELGWRVLIVWECDIKANINSSVDAIVKKLREPISETNL